MNKSIKLLQLYPNLPTDWEVGMLLDIGDDGTNYYPCNAKYSTIGIYKGDVEKCTNIFSKYVFTTEDGVDVYEDMNFYWYRTMEKSESFTDIPGTYGLYTGDITNRTKSPHYKWFVSEGALIEYMDNDKRKFKDAEETVEALQRSEVIHKYSANMYLLIVDIVQHFKNNYVLDDGTIVDCDDTYTIKLYEKAEILLTKIHPTI